MRAPRLLARKPVDPIASTRARRALLAACAVLAVLPLLGGAAAQTATSSGTLTADSIRTTASVLLPGQSAGLFIEATRACAHQGQVLPAGTLQVHAVTQSAVLAITGPTSIPMEQLVCVQRQSQHIQVRLNATARSDAAQALGENFTSLDAQVVFQLHTDASTVGSPPPQDAVISTLFVVQAPERAVVLPAADEEQVAPAGSLVAVLAVLGLVAVALRRRRE